MKILIVGNGGREHALLHVLRRDRPDASFFITGGNGGTSGLATSLPIAASDSSALAAWADAERIDLTIIGPEAPLADGIVDRFQERRLTVFGPSAAAARIESSKAWAKTLMVEAGVPTAGFATFTDGRAAEHYIRANGAPIVVKASGLAAGKGAIVCATEEDAIRAARSMLSEHAFGGAGEEIVIEECMSGEEISYFALTDGTNILLMPGAQDHKRIGEGDTGPNTGGMGAYAPVSLETAELRQRTIDEILLPTLAAMRAQDASFRGLLYAGLMLTSNGPRVVEFNCRFGDPETQALLPLLRSPLFEPLREIAAGGSIAGAVLEWDAAAAVTTVLASRGYPATSESGRVITISPDLERDPRITVFHAGTRLSDEGLVTAGGRVLAATAVAPTLAEAASLSREAASSIHFDGCQYRRDIGWRELERIGQPIPANH